jgi:hypothetical protein
MLLQSKYIIENIIFKNIVVKLKKMIKSWGVKCNFPLRN